jgi:hypothetical protein
MAREQLAIGSPDAMQIVTDRYHRVKVGAVQGLGSSFLEPRLGLGRTALGAGSVLTRIGKDHPIIAIGTSIDMISDCGGSTGHDVPGGAPLAGIQNAAFPIFPEMIVEYPLYDSRLHQPLLL